MSNKKSKNGRVELLRFIFAIMILLFHIQKRFGKVALGTSGFYLFNHGYIGVEFFFLVSGYLLAAGCYSKREKTLELLGSETAGMIWKKIKNIFPYHLFAMILTIAVNAYFLEKTAAARFDYVLKSWASVFFVQIFGFDSSWANKLTWYLDVWLVVTFIFYPLIRKNYDIFVKVVCPVFALFVLGYLDYTYGKLADIDVWTGHFYKCFLRGAAEMALGCSAYSLTRRLNKIDFSAAGRKILGLAEACCYIVTAIYACGTFDTHYEFAVLFLLMAGMILTFSNVNPAERIFSGPAFEWMGKMSLLVYLNQFFAIRLVQEVGASLSLGLKFVFCIGLTFICSIVCNYLVAFLLKKQYLKNLFLKKEEA